MDKDWRNELITKGAAFDALTEVESHYEFEDGHDHLMRWAKTKIFVLPPAQQLSCDGCRHDGMWDDELEEGYDCPCTRCMRNVRDNYEA